MSGWYCTDIIFLIDNQITIHWTYSKNIEKKVTRVTFEFLTHNERKISRVWTLLSRYNHTHHTNHNKIMHHTYLNCKFSKVLWRRNMFGPCELHITQKSTRYWELHSQPDKSSMEESRNSFSLTQRNLAHLNIASSQFQAVSHTLILFEHIQILLELFSHRCSKVIFCKLLK